MSPSMSRLARASAAAKLPTRSSSIVAGAFLCSPAIVSSLDYLIRPRQHSRWDRQADLFGRFKIDDEFKLCGLLDRKIRRLSAFENLVDVSGGTMVHVGNVHAVGH